MLPLQQAFEVRQSIIEYLKATFNFKEKEVYESFYNFIENDSNGIFKGPYISLKLPFETFDGGSIPLEIKPQFPPYKHQFQSFKRLSTNEGQKPSPTLLTTGTGSGKTESFLYPILDYCHQQKGKSGIKVIILYPMNALATDQAKRLAETIFNDERLKEDVTAGLFIGEGKNKSQYPKTMGETHIIENRDEIVANPPDILLTNFKMLDYALLRHNYHNLWKHNFSDPTLLQFLVLDELHTYDGAQGTDVANLIRRLKLKLKIPKKHLCPVGTSATIGKGANAIELLTKYASEVFGEIFNHDSVITEHRVTPEVFFPSAQDLDSFLPRVSGIEQSRMGLDENYLDYLIRQKKLWQIPENCAPFDLSKELKKLQIVKDLITTCSDGVIGISELKKHLDQRNEGFRKLSAGTQPFDAQEEIITSLLALIAAAKSDPSERFPFLFLQIQLWVRELSGLLREISEEVKFTWRDKIGGKYEDAALPPYFCRECGASGWFGVKHDNRNQFELDPLDVYDKYFSGHKNLYLINKYNESHIAIDEYEPSTSFVSNSYVNQIDLSIHDYPSDKHLKIIAYRKYRENKSQHICPECNSQNSLSITGTRVATLNSISVSQILSSDLDSNKEQYRKVLAFTNGVQDAAHQAGFVEARNYRFTFRSSLQKVINSVGTATSLVELKKEFISYWKNNSDPSGQNHLEAYFYRFFPSDYHGKAEVESYRNPITGEFSKEFISEFDERVYWEILSEFGFSATLGRTLEKTNSSAITINGKYLEGIFKQILPWLTENNIQAISKEEFDKFLFALLTRIRLRGGLDHVHLSKFRSNDLKLWDLNWNRDSRHFLNKNYHPRTRFPKLVTSVPHSSGVVDSSFAKRTNWFHTYFKKSFPLTPDNPALINEFYETLFNTLSNSTILNSVNSKQGVNYALDPSKWEVSPLNSTYSCNECSSEVQTVLSSTYLQDAKCLNYRCKGSYSIDENRRFNYYNKVYNRTLSPRIYASEHTGVLERSVREETEYDFKERPNYNSLNTLVATSTLEMGIDVGSLNSAINTSIPPLSSNFLQRIGRAGRSSGSAFIENFAQNKAHDLFYYEEPKEMMEGDINTPGCFLNARDILERHFTAYCFDTWTAMDPENHQIPGTIKLLDLMKSSLTDTAFFINQLMLFVSDNCEDLVNAFQSKYENSVDQSSFDLIKRSIVQDTFKQKLVRVFENLKEELFFLHKKQKEIKETIKEKGLGKDDPERKELEAEQRSIWHLQRNIQSRQTIEHLTNEGILPNYAFPETGVTLNAQVYGFKPEGAQQDPVNKSFEIVRSASSALREFAPDNTFYSQGNKLEITGLNTFDWGGQRSSLVEMRFCSNCDHIEEELKSTKGACPKCGHESWNSSANKHMFARLRSVKSMNSRATSALNDHKDDRIEKHYKVSTHFNFNDKSVEGTFGMKKIPFGIEFVKDVTLSKVNLGIGQPHAEHLTINQFEEIPRHGFVTCRHCGRSTSVPRDIVRNDKKSFHYGYCKYKNEPYSDLSNHIFEEVFLYRSVKTEAIKILLPVQEFLNEATQQMFKAGLELGLKKYYDGNPEHITFEFYSEFNEANNHFDRYLVALDTIPGGTGYLQKLFSTEEFTKLLKQSYESIKSCSCKNKGKDGCYRCILSYANQYIREDLSRQEAEELFGKIVRSAEEDWEKIDEGLSSLTKSGMIEESELEKKFIFALQKFALSKRTEGFDFEEFKEGGINTYKIKIPTSKGSVTYIIRPQKELGQVDGINENTRTDFLFKCTEVEENGEPITDIDIIQSFKSVALYLDGYTYHASDKHMRFYDDLRIRRAINATQEFQSWSLSWEDVVLFESHDPGKRLDNLVASQKEYGPALSKISKMPSARRLDQGLLNCVNSIERLIWYLSNSNRPNLQEELGFYFAAFQKDFGKHAFDQTQLDKFLNDCSEVEYSEKPNKHSIIQSNLTKKTPLFLSCVCVALLDFRGYYSLREENLDEIELFDWKDFLRRFSLYEICG